MFQNSLTILRLLDIEIKIAPSWFLIAVLITWSLADQVFPAQIPGLPPGQALGLGVIAMILFFASLLLHELAHAVVAKSTGLKVPRITLFLFGGVAELGDEPETAYQEFWIAVAGPITSLVLAGLFWMLSLLLTALGDGGAGPILLSYLATINLVIALFNMLPAFPLDGGRVLRAILWARSNDLLKATQRAARFGEILAFALMAFGLLSLFQGFHLSGAWQILIGIFLLFAARGAVETLRTKTLLQDQTVADVMTRNVITAHPDITLLALVDRLMLPNRISFVPVVEKDVLLGHIDAAVLAMIDRENWPTTSVGDVFIERNAELIVAPHAFAFDVFTQFAKAGCRKMIVMEGEHLCGVVTLSDLGRVLQLLSDLHRLPQQTART